MSFVSLCLPVSPFVCLHSFICFLALVGVSAFLDFCLLVFPFICLAGLVTVFTSLRPSFLLCPFASSFHGWGVGVWAFGHFVSHFCSPWSGFWCQSSLDPSWDGVTKFAVCSHSFVSPIIFLALGLLGWENCLLLVTCFSVSLCDSLVVLCLPTLPLSCVLCSFVFHRYPLPPNSGSVGLLEPTSRCRSVHAKAPSLSTVLLPMLCCCTCYRYFCAYYAFHSTATTTPPTTAIATPTTYYLLLQHTTDSLYTPHDLPLTTHHVLRATYYVLSATYYVLRTTC